jgi:hypothetical protein
MQGMEVVPPASKKSGQPDNWDFFDDGVWFSAPDRFALAAKVRDHREANNQPLGNPLQEVLDFNIAKTRTVHPKKIDRTLRELVVKWLESKLRTKPKYVDLDEANRRAAICATCPRNIMGWQEGEKCVRCKENANRATAIILMGRPQHRPIGACELLKQSNTAAVWLDEAKVQDENLPDFCWRKA